MDGTLIAETGEAGEIVWLWVARAGGRLARPYDPGQHGGLDLARYGVSGASRVAVERFLTRQAMRGSCRV